jgi:hypothetical protein
MTLPEAPRVVDVYTKNGDIGVYAAEFGLVPDWDVGCLVLQAGSPLHSSGGDWLTITQLIASIIFPAVEAAAREQADQAYSGTYVSSDPSLNSSITISTSATEPGLGVTNWISNGTDIFSTFALLLLGTPEPPSIFSVRLYPTDLITAIAGGGSEVSWRAVVEEITSTPTPAATLNLNCFDWSGVDAYRYGMVGIDDFIFNLDANGMAVSTSPRVLRVVLEKK